MSETKNIEKLIDPEGSEATTVIESPVSQDPEIDSKASGNSTANASEADNGDAASVISNTGTNNTSKEPQNVFDDAFQRTEDNTCTPMQLSDAESKESESNDDGESVEIRTKYARVPIKVYAHPNEKSRSYETTGTYHIIGENILNCFQKVVCAVPGIGRVEGYIKVNGGR